MTTEFTAVHKSDKIEEKIKTSMFFQHVLKKKKGKKMPTARPSTPDVPGHVHEDHSLTLSSFSLHSFQLVRKSVATAAFAKKLAAILCIL